MKEYVERGYVPEDILSNGDLEKLVDTNDEWIRTRTGISERRILISACQLSQDFTEVFEL